MKEAKQEAKEEAKVIITIGVETGEIRVTNVGGKKMEYEAPVTIEGIIEVPQLAILQTKSSPG